MTIDNLDKEIAEMETVLGDMMKRKEEDVDPRNLFALQVVIDSRKAQRAALLDQNEIAV